MEKEILESEEHYDEVSLQGANQAKKYLEELLKFPDKGLLEHEIIITVNKKLLQNEKGSYCPNQRMTTYQGQNILYCHPEDIYSRMQTIVDRFNYRSLYRHQVLEALAEFVIDFLDIHPFS